MATSIFAPAPAPGPAQNPGGNEIAPMPAVAPGGNERPAVAPNAPGAPGAPGAYATPTPTSAQAPGAAHAVSAALGAALGAPSPAAVGGNITSALNPTSPGPTAFGPPPSQLAANPAYVSFLNSLGLSDADLQNAAASKAAQTWQSEQAAQQATNLSLQNAQTRTANEQAGVGLENSSQALNAQGLLQQAAAAKIGALQNAAAQSVNNTYVTLAGQQAQGQQNLANVGTNVAGASNIAATLAANPTGSYAVGGTGAGTGT